MNTIIVGGNGFIDCPVILAFENTPVLSVENGKIAVRVPSRTGNPLLISEPGAERSTGVFVRTYGNESISFFRHFLVLTTIKLSSTETHVQLDLRPFGVRVFSDAEGLHVGHHNFFNLRFQGVSPAIKLTADGQIAQE